MAAHGSHSHEVAALDEKVRLGHALSGVKFGALLVGVVFVAIAVVFGFFLTGDDARLSHAKFYHGWLIGVIYCMTIGLGSLIFVLLQHMVKVGWSVNVRRVPEAMAASLTFLGLLALPLLIPVLGRKGGELYSWAVPLTPEHAEHAQVMPAAGTPLPQQFASADDTAAKNEALIDQGRGAQNTSGGEHARGEEPANESEFTHNSSASVEHGGSEQIGGQTAVSYDKPDDLTYAKKAWLNPGFFSARIIFYFGVWTIVAWYFYGRSKAQDVSGDAAISVRLAILAPVGIIATGLTLTFAAFDLLMSLDHHWFSTIFGVYVFAGSMMAQFATMIVAYRWLQSRGFVTRSITTEHYHDMGKFLFTFVFFWGYIGFGQFLLQWYAALPEEIGWWARRGVTIATLPINTISTPSQFSPLSYVLLFGHFILPFAYLLSRHIKRSKAALLAGACWMLLMHLVDISWLVLPELQNGQWIVGVSTVAAFIGVVALFIFAFVQILSGANLRPIRDPRAVESLAFVNM